MTPNFTHLASIFQIPGEIISIEQISNGNINQTYDVKIAVDSKTEHDGNKALVSDTRISRYVFQKINIYVFNNPKHIMSNIDKITTHIALKLEALGLSCDSVMHFHKTIDGKNFYMEEQGFWRVSDFVSNSITYNMCDDLNLIEEAGKAFGNFQMLLSDFDAGELYETIADFHNTRSRIAHLMRHFNEDACGRAEEVADEIAWVRKYTKDATKLNELLDSGELTLRVTHNDTKINNVLFDKDTNKAKTVIDLDTVMPGLVAHDFGDAVRSACNNAAEDEKDVSKVSLNLDKFRAFASGFVPAVSKALTKVELDTLALGAFVISLELGVRFLDDYITGDKYFKTNYNGHNLVRARAQFALAEDIYNKLDKMNEIIEEIIIA